MITSLSQLLRRTRGKSARSCSLAGLADLRPVNAHPRGTRVNKAGRLVLRAEGERGPVKVYEAASEEHADFIRAVSNNGEVADLFPPVLETRGPFVVTDWIVAWSNKRADPECLSNILLRLHAVNPGGLPKPGFDYWQEILVPRFLRAAALLHAERLARAVVAEVSVAMENCPSTLVHPDVTPDNVLSDGPGRWKIVDNELLTSGRIPLLDVCNAAHALGAGRGDRLAQAWLRGAKHHPGIPFKNVRMAWLVRRTGSAYVAGRFDEVAHYLHCFHVGDWHLPFRVGEVG